MEKEVRMKYSIDATKLLRGVLLTILTLFLIHLVKSGDIQLLVSPIIAKIVDFSIVPFIVITIATLKYSLVPSKQHDHHHDHGHHHSHVHMESCDCGHEHAKPNSFWAQTTIGLLFVSLAIAYSWHPKALGTEMIANAKTQDASVPSGNPTVYANSNTNIPTTTNTSTNSSTSSDHTAYAPGIQNVNEDTVGITTQTSEDSEASIAMRYGEDPKKYWGKQVELDGFVYHPAGLPKNHFVLTRFFIFCCVADASPIGITVNSDLADQLKNDTWVHVTGVIQPETLPVLDQILPTNWYPTDPKKPVIQAKTISIIPTPDKPYMIPK
jgi:putative membrane protein